MDFSDHLKQESKGPRVAYLELKVSEEDDGSKVMALCGHWEDSIGIYRSEKIDGDPKEVAELGRKTLAEASTLKADEIEIEYAWENEDYD